MTDDGQPMLTPAEAVVVSAQSHGSDAALIALAYLLGERIERCTDPFALQQLAARQLDVLRELGWTPHTRAADDDDEYRTHAELGSPTIRHATQQRPRELGA